MAQIATKHLDKFEGIKRNIEDSHQSFQHNYDRYDKMRRFVFRSSLSTEDVQTLRELDKPDLEFNVLEAYISRLIGEWSKQTPSFKSRALNNNADPLTVSSVEAHLRHILAEANNHQMSNEVYKESLSGGFSAMRIWTEYEHDRSFNQNLKLGKVYDPTLCGFDPLARDSHKGDGKFCYHLYPLTKEEFEKDWPNVELNETSWQRGVGGFEWYYNSGQKEVLLLAEYYEKERRKVRLHNLSNGQVVTDKDYRLIEETWNSIEQMPVIIESRWSTDYYITRYTILGDKMLDRQETNFTYLPLVFVDGNSVILKDNDGGSSYQFTRPYIYHAVDSQRLKNYCGQTFANEMENMPTQKYMVEFRSVPGKLHEEWADPQRTTTLLYQSMDEDGAPLPPPTAVPREPIDRLIYDSFAGAERTIQNILGSYDASLGINNNQLSGVAIVEGATQSNAAAMPYVTNFMAALNQVALILVDMLPKYYITPRTIPIVKLDGKREFIEINKPAQNPEEKYISFMYPHNSLEVTVEAGVNFKIQQMRALNVMTEMARSFPAFAQFINDKGLGVLLSNLDIRNVDVLVKLAEEYMAEKEKVSQSQVQNPEANLEQQKMHLEYEKMGVEAIQSEREIQQKEADRKVDLIKAILKAETEESKNKVQDKKAQAEIFSKTEDVALARLESGKDNSEEIMRAIQDIVE